MTKCCVLGSGKLGSRIAGQLALHGHRVNVYDQNEVYLGQLPSIVSEQIRNLIKQGLTASDHSFMNNIKICRTLAEAVQDVDFIFEAVSENLATKKFVYQKITHLCSSQTVIGSNTLNLKIEDFTENVLFSERIIGIRFLYPVYCIPLVEYTTTNNTDTDVINAVKIFFDAMGKKLFQRLHGQQPKMLSAKEVEYYVEDQRRRVAQQQRENTNPVHHGSQRDSPNGTEVPTLQDPHTPTTEHIHGHNNEYSQDRSHGRQGHGITTTHDVSQTRIAELIAGHNEGCPSGHGRSSGSENNCAPATHTTEQSDGLGERVAPLRLDHSVCPAGLNSHPTCPTNGNHPSVYKLGPAMSPPNSAPQSRTECVVCEEDDINTVLLPCRHMWLCFACAKILQGRRDPCPACRSPIEDIIAVYKP